MTIPDRELEHSPLSGRHTSDGITVEVLIYRLAGTRDPWQLEVVDQQGGSTVWDEGFGTDRDAYKAFFEDIEASGIRQFMEPSETRH